MDNPSEVYKKDDNNFIIVSELTDKEGNTIIVPVRINGKGAYNNVFIDENHITSVYGKKNLENYLANNNFEKVDTKKGTTLNEGVQYSNISNSSDNSVSQNPENASGKSAKAGDYRVYGKDIALEKVDVAEIAPTTESLSVEYAPLTEAEANEVE